MKDRFPDLDSNPISRLLYALTLRESQFQFRIDCLVNEIAAIDRRIMDLVEQRQNVRAHLHDRAPPPTCRRLGSTVTLAPGLIPRARPVRLWCCYTPPPLAHTCALHAGGDRQPPHCA